MFFIGQTDTDLEALRILLECIHVWFGSIEDFERGPAQGADCHSNQQKGGRYLMPNGKNMGC